MSFARSGFSIASTLILTGTFYIGVRLIARVQTTSEYLDEVGLVFAKRAWLFIFTLPIWVVSFFNIEGEVGPWFATFFLFNAIVSLCLSDWALAGLEKNELIARLVLMGTLCTLCVLFLFQETADDRAVGSAFFLGNAALVFTMLFYITNPTIIALSGRERLSYAVLRSSIFKKFFILKRDFGQLLIDGKYGLIFWLIELNLAIEVLIIGWSYSIDYVGEFKIAAQIQLLLYMITKTLNIFAFRRASVGLDFVSPKALTVFYFLIVCFALLIYKSVMYDVLEFLYPSINAGVVYEMMFYCLWFWLFISLYEFGIQQVAANQPTMSVFAVALLPVGIKLVCLYAIKDSVWSTLGSFVFANFLGASGALFLLAHYRRTVNE